MFLISKSLYRFSLDFSKLSPEIVSAGIKNYKIQAAEPIDGYLSKNATNK
jgi:hypothetical protein